MSCPFLDQDHVVRGVTELREGCVPQGIGYYLPLNTELLQRIPKGQRVGAVVDTTSPFVEGSEPLGRCLSFGCEEDRPVIPILGVDEGDLISIHRPLASRDLTRANTSVH